MLERQDEGKESKVEKYQGVSGSEVNAKSSCSKISKPASLKLNCQKLQHLIRVTHTHTHIHTEKVLTVVG